MGELYYGVQYYTDILRRCSMQSSAQHSSELELHWKLISSNHDTVH
jgi:hypothetical protein